MNRTDPLLVPMPGVHRFANYAGWDPVRAGSTGGAGRAYADNMAETATTPRSPRHLHKRRRLSRLLDKLAIQLQNNNHYPPPHWLMLDSTGYESPNETDNDVPLDLSIKSRENSTRAQGAVHASFACNDCGQTFILHDRLSKHIASRHRGPLTEPIRPYECEVCQRRFARSDMLTRHARLHSGVKPYSCAACGQVFSRSDHLATHQRTHTGEKPYRCPECPYAACRRDMITRHMRTHARSKITPGLMTAQTSN